MQDGDVVETLHRQNQVRQLEDTWPMDGLCIYKYQLAAQIEQRDRWNHPSQHTHSTHMFISHKSLTSSLITTRSSDILCIDEHMCANLGVFMTPASSLHLDIFSIHSW